jgi:hypothetical protein
MTVTEYVLGITPIHEIVQSEAILANDLQRETPTMTRTEALMEASRLVKAHGPHIRLV